ncbi:ribosomal protection-like ABC-F family protein [Halobacillus naozhouensis]|uniref:ABC-F family ATP-binding cassette domain-containing protein n=1 Tax=Halobacillus naozhouensis TaxID=554880 RepID=A0ABY8J1I4_9BACI|nr:ABC-F family ATP-binding cassette domain-containing protein [Halobacillus naozhouensis]WFT75279.1 ABC-F family ATP-binding cassette domain-containing protein [Halobacillus naozhouensis]
MILLQLNQLTKRFGAELILSNIKLEVQMNDRIAIVGRNGSGKSTLLKMMAGELSYDSGDIFKPKDVTMEYLAQNTGLDSEESIWNEMEKVFAHLKGIEKELRDMEAEMADPELFDNHEAYQKLLSSYDERQDYFKRAGGYHYEADIKAVLNGLNFHDFDWNTPITSLSGGQKTRLALGKLLLTKPDVLILDEPTNHLDIETLSWLEGYLQGYEGAVVIVSHDRYFLDKIVNTVYEIAHQGSKKYHGNYSNYLQKKEADYELELKSFEKQQSEIKRMEEFIQKNIVRATTSKRAQSRRKQLEKMDKLEKPKTDQSSATFSFQVNKKSGNDVLKLNDLSFRYDPDSPMLFDHLSMNLQRGDSVALVGPNGVGKTTLLKTIIGELKASGTMMLGTNVQIGYYDQEQTNLNSKKTVLNELWDDYPLKNEKDIRTILGNFLFSGDDVLKPVSALSGGEKARLSLAKLMMQEANFLILDEPTNHLDLDSKEVLESALIDYPGTLLFVSHDRYFINKIATQVVEMHPKETRTFLGDYDYYVQKKQEELELQQLEEAEAAQQATGDSGEAQIKNSFQQDKANKREERKRQRRITEIEQQIEEVEIKIEEIESLLCDPEIYQDHEKSLELTESNQSYQQQIETLMEEWEQLHE